MVNLMILHLLIIPIAISGIAHNCEGCESKGHLVNSLVTKINSLSLQVKKLQRDKLYSTTKSSTVTWR